jgi:hypothetical protein
MGVMLKLKLPPDLQNIEAVKKLDGLSDLDIDDHFGLIPVKPEQALYVVQVSGIDRVEERKRLCPVLIEVYGDQRIEEI